MVLTTLSRISAQKLCDSSAIRHPIPEVFRELPGCGANRVRVDAEGHVRRGRAGKKKGKQRHRHQHRQ